MKKFLMMTALTLSMAAPAFAGDKEDWFKMIDKDGNGMISKAEHDAASEEKFTMMDANKDGSVSMDEMKVGKEKMEDKKDTMKD